MPEETLIPTTPELEFAGDEDTDGKDTAIGDDHLEANPYELVIRPSSGWIGINWKEIIAGRELLFFLIRRDILVRYKQTVLGAAWAVLQPLILMSVFTFVGRVAQIDFGGLPRPVFIFAGLIPWALFSQGMPQSSLSLVNQQNLLTKVYFPRLYVPFAAASVFLVDLTISLVIYAVILACYHIMPSWTVVFLPILIVLTLMATLGFGVFIAALTVFYRDFKHIVPFAVQFFMFVTPVFYRITKIEDWRIRAILALNPMFGIINGYRSVILGIDWDPVSLVVSSVSAVALFLFAMLYFRRTERQFADFA